MQGLFDMVAWCLEVSGLSGSRLGAGVEVSA